MKTLKVNVNALEIWIKKGGKFKPFVSTLSFFKFKICKIHLQQNLATCVTLEAGLVHTTWWYAKNIKIYVLVKIDISLKKMLTRVEKFRDKNILFTPTLKHFIKLVPIQSWPEMATTEIPFQAAAILNWGCQLSSRAQFPQIVTDFTHFRVMRKHGKNEGKKQNQRQRQLSNHAQFP